MSGRVLIIDDDYVTADVYKNTLEMDGYEVKWADSIYKAYEILEYFEPNVFLIDRLLPEVSGDNFLHSYDFTNSVPIIMTSSYFDDNYIAESMKCGALFVYTKPIALELIRISVKRATNYSELLMSFNELNDAIGEAIDYLKK